MVKPEHNKTLTVPQPGKIEFVNRPYPRVKPGSVLVKTEIAAVCVDDRMYTDHEFPMTEAEEVFKIPATQHNAAARSCTIRMVFQTLKEVADG
jgi:hypothetical protein